jgi:hypothetical protein
VLCLIIKENDKLEFEEAMSMNKKAITIMAVLTAVIAFMDISGLPATMFIDCILRM